MRRVLASRVGGGDTRIRRLLGPLRCQHGHSSAALRLQVCRTRSCSTWHHLPLTKDRMGLELPTSRETSRHASAAFRSSGWTTCWRGSRSGPAGPGLSNECAPGPSSRTTPATIVSRTRAGATVSMRMRRYQEISRAVGRSYLTLPFPSMRVMLRSMPATTMFSFAPLGHSISSFSTVVEAPRPKCTRRSELDA
jgi:hypothetical protein